MYTLMHIYTHESCRSDGGPTQTNKHPPKDVGLVALGGAAVNNKKKGVTLCFCGSTVEKKRWEKEESWRRRGSS